jgi:hypothetical protein
MTENDEPCMELNEIIYYISGEFWLQAYNTLLCKQNVYIQEHNVSGRQNISDFKKSIKQLTKENQLKCKSFIHNKHYYMSLVPFPIYIGIERETGDFSVSAPHISTEHFTHLEYDVGLKWIQDYIDIDIKPLTDRTMAVHDKFYLNTKSAEIVRSSIKALCESILGKKELKYNLNQSRLKTVIYIAIKKNTAYEITVYHKPFSRDTSLLINLLDNLHKEYIEDVLSCELVKEPNDL